MFTTNTLTLIENHRPLSLAVPWENELTFPDYERLSIRNIPHSIAEILGAPLPNSTPLDKTAWSGELPQAQRVFLVLLDGMGWYTLQSAVQNDSAIAELVAEITDGHPINALTSVAPSTTAVALASLWTGATPSQLGLFGTGLHIPPHSTPRYDMLSYTPYRSQGDSISPREVVKQIPVGVHLAQANIPTYVILKRLLVRSGLSEVIHQGVNFVPHEGYSDTNFAIAETLAETRGKHAYVYYYWEGIDTISHHHHLDSARTRHEIRVQLTHLRDALKSERSQDGQTLVMIAADHGQRAVDKRYTLQGAELGEYGICGDNRLAHLHAQELPVLPNWDDDVLVVKRDEAWALFGGESEYSGRMGEWVLIPRPQTIVQDEKTTFPFVSFHGGLTHEEMLVPLLWRKI
jgi:hypothetical protein